MSLFTCSLLSDPDGCLRIALAGAIDLESRAGLSAALEATGDAAPGRIDADLSAVSFFSAEGATFLLRLRRYADEHAIQLLLDAPPSDAVRRVLARVGLNDTFGVVPAAAPLVSA